MTMAEVGEVRRRVRLTIERAKREAAERRARADVGEAEGRRFVQEVAAPLARQFISVVKAEGVAFRLSTPAGGLAVVSEIRREDFIELLVDSTQDPPAIMTKTSYVRGQRVSTTERPLGPGVSLEHLTEEHVLTFLLESLPTFVER